MAGNTSDPRTPTVAGFPNINERRADPALAGTVRRLAKTGRSHWVIGTFLVFNMQNTVCGLLRVAD